MEQQFILARIKEAARLCEQTSAPKFLGFLTADEIAVAVDCLKNTNAKFTFWGGYKEAERNFLGCLPEWCCKPQFPITALTVTYRLCDKLTHRDFLGSLMALGITRETVGDILCESGRTVIFVRNDIAEFICSQLKKVGKVGVNISKGFIEPLPRQSEKIMLSSTVASLRLDCVVSALAGVSRNAALELIESGFVALNSATIQKATASIKDSDTLSIKGKGKFFIESTDGVTKKQRTILKYSVYK